MFTQQSQDGLSMVLYIYSTRVTRMMLFTPIHGSSRIPNPVDEFDDYEALFFIYLEGLNFIGQLQGI